MTEPLYDLAIIGGGINGAGIAADAAARGLSVVLFEGRDLASGTSSASSKLIHGGLRYLEHFDFRLVRESLQEREVLLAKAPHIVRPLRFVLPHVEGMRPRAMIRAGLFLYDHLARRRKIPGSSSVDLRRDPMGRALRSDFNHAFSYWDCWADDARLVVLNARAAALNGAFIHTRTQVTGLVADGGNWSVHVTPDAGSRTVCSRAVVNAAGPWVEVAGRLAIDRQGPSDQPKIRLVKGSHIVVPRIAGADDAFLLQNSDGRVVFALPYEEHFTLIGTTDVAYTADPGAAAIDSEEVDYLLGLANRFFVKTIERSSIVWQFSGVRPLFDDGNPNASAVSRDYRLELSSGPAMPPLLTVYGGKLTTYRKLAEAAVDRLAPHFPGLRSCTTALTTLPGGDIGPGGIESFLCEASGRWPGLPQSMLASLFRRYGTLISSVLGDAKSVADLGARLGGGLYEREARYLRDHEWAREPDDVLWRRTKAGLHMGQIEREIAADRLQKLL